MTPDERNRRRWDQAATGGAAVAGARSGTPRGPAASSGGAGGGRGWDGSLVEWYDNSGDPYERPIMPEEQLVIAREFLMGVCRIPGSRQFRLKRWGGKWWWYQDGSYGERTGEAVVNMVHDWLSGFDKRLRRSRGKDVLVRFAPTRHFCKAVCESLSGDCFCAELPELPAWLRHTLGPDDRPMWGVLASLTEPDWQHVNVGRPDPRNLVIYRNGLLDLGEVARTGHAVLKIHTPDLFSMGGLPYDLPLDALRELLAAPDDGPVRREVEARVYPRICPQWWDFIKAASFAGHPEATAQATAAHEDGCSDLEEDGGAASNPDPEPDWAWIDTAQEMFGETLDADRSVEKIYVPVGDQRTGKDTILLGVETVCGARNVCALEPMDFSDRFGLFKLVGKKAALMGEGELGKFDDPGAMTAKLKMLRGRSPISVRDLYSPAVSVRNSARVWIAANRLPTQLRDPSGALADSLIVLPMRRSWLNRENAKVKGSVSDEGPGISVWAIMGAVRIRRRADRERRRYIMEHPVGVALKEAFKRISATLKVFLSEWCVTGEGCEEECGRLYTAYSHMCKEDGLERTGKSRFFMDLAVLLPHFGTHQPVRRNEMGEASRRRVVCGVKLHQRVPVEWTQPLNDGPPG